jgi:hypothetical protein
VPRIGFERAAECQPAVPCLRRERFADKVKPVLLLPHDLTGKNFVDLELAGRATPRSLFDLYAKRRTRHQSSMPVQDFPQFRLGVGHD